MEKTICILADKYPNPVEPTTNMFIQQLAWEFADISNNVIVICPMPINFNKAYKKLEEVSFETTENGEKITIFRPKYISLGQSNLFLENKFLLKLLFSRFQKLRVKITTFLYGRSVKKIIKKYKLHPNFIYSYFVCPASVVAARLTKKYGIPSFMEHGEAFYTDDKKYGNKKLAKEFEYLTGVIAVSNQNKMYLTDAKVVNEDKIVVYPNCYREERFFKIDKQKAREYFNIDKDKFIVGYCGSLDDRKGVLRVEAAVDKISGAYMAFAGKGPLKPQSDKVLFCKPVAHDELIYFYNSLDVFVLPTLGEGSCTATAEAIGCGCPIISSDRIFNEFLCFDCNSLLVDPTNVEDIQQKIEILLNDRALLKKLSEGSLEVAKTLHQKERMKKVFSFMQLKAKTIKK